MIILIWDLMKSYRRKYFVTYEAQMLAKQLPVNIRYPPPRPHTCAHTHTHNSGDWNSLIFLSHSWFENFWVSEMKVLCRGQSWKKKRWSLISLFSLHCRGVHWGCRAPAVSAEEFAPHWCALYCFTIESLNVNLVVLRWYSCPSCVRICICFEERVRLPVFWDMPLRSAFR